MTWGDFFGEVVVFKQGLCIFSMTLAGHTCKQCSLFLTKMVTFKSLPLHTPCLHPHPEHTQKDGVSGHPPATQGGFPPAFSPVARLHPSGSSVQQSWWAGWGVKGNAVLLVPCYLE